MQKMLDGITKEPNLRDQMIAERCAQIALEFFGATKPALSMFGVVESVCDACHGFDARAGRLGIGHLGCHKCGK